jgi:hypothetical protein
VEHIFQTPFFNHILQYKLSHRAAADIAVADKQYLNQYENLLSSAPICRVMPRFAAIIQRLSADTFCHEKWSKWQNGAKCGKLRQRLVVKT